MNVKIWGSPGWQFYHTITFNYPEKIDLRNPIHRDMKKYYKQLFENLQHTLPCIYCRESFKKFILELPIDAYLHSRKAITYWFYEIHNKVNNKLRNQEEELLSKEFLKFKKSHPSFTKSQLRTQFKKMEKKYLYTKPNPTYGDICRKYEKQRANCAKRIGHIESCRI